MATTFPRQFARTNRFTTGAPRSFTVAPDGSRVLFLRSRGTAPVPEAEGAGAAGDGAPAQAADRSNALWAYEPEDTPSAPHATREGGREWRERMIADPRELLGGATEELTPEERARRERSRESSAGIVGYAADKAAEVIVFTLSGRLFTVSARTGKTAELTVPGPVADPRPSPDGRRVAYVSGGGTLRVVGADGSGDRALAEPEAETVTYGLAEFIAAEEMMRDRGHWWSPDGEQLLAARADDAPVHRWWISDPAHPGQRPAEVAYPAAGTPNAEVTLHLFTLGPADGGPARAASRTEVRWDRARYPYLARVHWSAGGPPLLQVQTRDQREVAYLSVDTATGGTAPVRVESDPAWVELFAGVPAWTADGRLLRIADREGARRLYADDTALTGPALHVRAVLDVGERDVLFSASPGGDSPEADTRIGDVGVYRVALDGGDGAPGAPERIAAPGEEDAATVASAVRGGETLVLSSAALDRPGSRAAVLRLPAAGARGTGGAPAAPAPPTALGTIASHAERPVLSAAPQLRRTGPRRIPAAVLLPTGYREGDGVLPVLLDPYGGPHGQRVVAAQNAYLTSQWFADQGFAVVVADGRGTPGHSPAWEKAVHGALATVPLEDQVEALTSLAESHPLDLGRVGIRGWSFGGLLAAVAVLRRPDVFHAAVAGAPVTDQRLYDTHYTERYLGLPEENGEAYAASSVVTDEGLSAPADPQRPLMLVHGLADDNVTVAHTLRLSSALLAAGRTHEVLPLTGVTHMTPQEQVAENLLLLQLAFLKRALRVA